MGAMGTSTPIGMNDGLLGNDLQFFDSLDHQPIHPTSLPSLAPSIQAEPVTTNNSPLFTCFSSHPHSKSPSPSSSSSSSKRKAPSDQDPEEQAAVKRQRNTLAARKYRQKRLDRIAELEKALEEMTSDRDGLRLKLARKEAQVDAMKEMLSSSK